MKQLNRWMPLGMLALGSLVLTGMASAAQITGSMPLSASDTAANALNGADIGSSTTVSMPGTFYLGGATGDYTAVTFGSDFGPNTLDLNNLGAFSLPGNVFGAFGGVYFSEILVHTQFNLDVYLEGIFTPDGAMPGVDPGPTGFRLSINQTGASVSEAITLSSPPDRPDVPEPGTWVLLTAGIGAIAFGRRRLKA